MGETPDRAAWLAGPGAECRLSGDFPDRPCRLALLGAPGVGKGTQAELLSQSLKACHLSAGDVFRAAKCVAAEGLSPAMRAASGFMDRGELVPDETVIQMVAERVGCLKCRCGFLLDGFPRTVAQAEALDNLLESAGTRLNAVLSFDLPEEQAVERLSGRRTCRECKTTFHVASKPPQVDGVCDRCHSVLYRREDDQPEAIRTRLRAYHESTAPLAAYYGARGLLVSVSAEGSPEEIFLRALAALGPRMEA